MCGIIGYVGPRPVHSILLKGLKRLEYRGYDSSGVAYFRGEKIEVTKAEGKIAAIERMLEGETLAGVGGGIGHTRWATHGKPSKVNSHPHRIADVVLVHNGIIENYKELREEIMARGYAPISETDSEIFGFLVHFEMETGTSFKEAVRKSFKRIHGSSSIVAMCERHPGLIVGVRNGSPLVVASSAEFGTILASDAQPILDYLNDVYFLENGDMVVAQSGEVTFHDLATGERLDRKPSHLDWGADSLDKQGYAHYMLKEINEQPKTIRDTISAHLNIEANKPFEFKDTKGFDVLSGVSKLSLLACGTSWHASMVGKYWMEQWAGISVDAELASEFRYRRPFIHPKQAVMGVSQSGETADTLAVVNDMKKRGVKTMAIANVRSSTLARESDAVFYTHAGPEIGVASTKAFTAQMLMLMLIAGRLGRDSNDPEIQKEVRETYSQLMELPHYISSQLDSNSATSNAIQRAAKSTIDSKGYFFIGRGYSYPLALEGALKLKEIAYVHAEGYAAGELKHGPIAMLDSGMCTLVIAPRDRWYEKTVSNLQEVKARSSKVIAIGHADDESLRKLADFYIPLPVSMANGPSLREELLPFLISPILQLFSYEIAVMKGTDVDQPRNLAKSVTVE